jgi:secreted trypsin-like serine protease
LRALPICLFHAAAAMMLAGMAMPARALLAGAYPDTPAARVDANTLTSPWAGVGSITYNGGTYTGTLISRCHVLTAAHAVPADPLASQVLFNLNYGSALSQRIPVARVHKHPDFVGFNTPNLNNDIAVLELAHEVPAGVPVYGLSAAPMTAGTVLTLVGYGASGNGSTGISIDRDPAVKRVGRNSADAFVADDEGSGENELYLFDFDGEPGSSNFLGGKTLGNAVETTFASGDSGGPAFVREGGAWKVAGVNTFVRFFPTGMKAMGRFGTGGGGQIVRAYRSWILRTIGAGDQPCHAVADLPANTAKKSPAPR